MRKIYIAHPFGGKQENKDKVTELIKCLAHHNPGTLFLSPIHNQGFYYDEIDYNEGMELCYTLMDLADEVYFPACWKESRGCQLEMRRCIGTGKKFTVLPYGEVVEGKKEESGSYCR